MNLYVADAELSETCGSMTKAIEQIKATGNQFVASLTKMAAIGYVSDAMAEALTSRKQIVSEALAEFTEASEPIEKGTTKLIQTIDDIDHL